MSPETRAGALVTGLGVVVLAFIVLAGSAAQRIAAAEGNAAGPSSATVAGGGVTLHSVDVQIPDGDRTFAGAQADAINNNCLACHSAGMVLTQPRLSRAEWQAEVEKMRKTYKAPIADADVPAIVDYLAALNNGD